MILSIQKFSNSEWNNLIINSKQKKSNLKNKKQTHIQKEKTPLNMEFSSLSEWLTLQHIHYTVFSNWKYLVLAWIPQCLFSHWWRANKCHNFFFIFWWRINLSAICFSHAILHWKNTKNITLRLFLLFPVNYTRHCSPGF